MTIHWKGVEQYFTVMLFVNTLTPRMKPWVIQSFLTFVSVERTNFTKFGSLENLSTLDLALSGVKGLRVLPACWNVMYGMHSFYSSK